MMRKFLEFATIVVAVLAIVGCKKEEKASVSIYPRSMECEVEGGTFTFSVTCNMEWTITLDNCTVDATVTPLSGEGNDVVTVVVPKNTSASVQQVKIKIYAKGTESSSTAYAAITQKWSPFIGVDNSQVEIPAEGGGRRVHITANEAWSAKGVTVTKAGSNDSWCNATILESASNIELNLSSDANNTGSTRYAKFTLSLNDHPEVNCSIEVAQKSL